MLERRVFLQDCFFKFKFGLVGINVVRRSKTKNSQLRQKYSVWSVIWFSGEIVSQLGQTYITRSFVGEVKNSLTTFGDFEAGDGYCT